MSYYQDAGLEKEHSLRLLEHLSVTPGGSEGEAGWKQTPASSPALGYGWPSLCCERSRLHAGKLHLQKVGPSLFQQIQHCHCWDEGTWEVSPGNTVGTFQTWQVWGTFIMVPWILLCVHSCFCPHKTRTEQSKQRWKQVGQEGRWNQ